MNTFYFFKVELVIVKIFTITNFNKFYLYNNYVIFRCDEKYYLLKKYEHPKIHK